MLRDAKAWRLPPTLLADDSDGSRRESWTAQDRLLVRALEAFERSLCPGCAQNRHRSMNPDMSGEFEAKAQVCYGCAALESARSKADPPKGVKHFIIDAGPADEELRPWHLDLTPDGEDRDEDD